MSTLTIAVDLARNVFEIAISPRPGFIQERKRLTRLQFEQFWVARASCLVVMEACSTSYLPVSPAHGGVYIDRLSRVWIEEYRAPYENSRRVVVAIDENGEILLRTSLPPRSRILAASASALVYATMDELDAETVTAVRLICRS
jgi:hypothetical protein